MREKQQKRQFSQVTGRGERKQTTVMGRPSEDQSLCLQEKGCAVVDPATKQVAAGWSRNIMDSECKSRIEQQEQQAPEDQIRSMFTSQPGTSFQQVTK